MADVDVFRHWMVHLPEYALSQTDASEAARALKPTSERIGNGDAWQAFKGIIGFKAGT